MLYKDYVAVVAVVEAVEVVTAAAAASLVFVVPAFVVAVVVMLDECDSIWKNPRAEQEWNPDLQLSRWTTYHRANQMVSYKAT